MKRVRILEVRPLLILVLFLVSCSADGYEEIPSRETAERRDSTTDSEENPEDYDVEPDPVRSPTMELWAQTVADEISPPDFPGHYRISSVYAADIDGDDDTDSIGAFGIYPGGLYAWSYVAVFLWKDNHLAIDASTYLGIGGNTQYAYTIDSVRDHRIFLDMRVWKSGDGHCCPSDSAKWVLQWRPGELIRDQ